MPRGYVPTGRPPGRPRKNPPFPVQEDSDEASVDEQPALNKQVTPPKMSTPSHGKRKAAGGNDERLELEAELLGSITLMRKLKPDARQFELRGAVAKVAEEKDFETLKDLLGTMDKAIKNRNDRQLEARSKLEEKKKDANLKPPEVDFLAQLNHVKTVDNMKHVIEWLKCGIADAEYRLAYSEKFNPLMLDEDIVREALQTLVNDHESAKRRRVPTGEASQAADDDYVFDIGGGINGPSQHGGSSSSSGGGNN